MTTPRKPTKKKATTPAKAKTADGPVLERALKRIAATAASDGHTSMRHIEAVRHKVEGEMTDGGDLSTSEEADIGTTATGVGWVPADGVSMNWSKAVEDEMIAMWDVPPSEEVPTAVIDARDSASQPTEALGIYHSDGLADLVSKGDLVVYADDEGSEWWATVTEVFANGTANLRVPGMGAAQVANGVPFAWEAGQPGTWVASDGGR